MFISLPLIARVPMPQKIKQQVIEAYTSVQVSSGIFTRFIKCLTQLEKEYPQTHTEPLLFWCLEYDKAFLKTLNTLCHYGFNPANYYFNGVSIWEKVIQLSNANKIHENRALMLLDILLPFKQNKYIKGNVSSYEKIKKVYHSIDKENESLLNPFEKSCIHSFETLYASLPQNKYVLYKFLDSSQVDETEKALLSYMMLEQCLLNTYYTPNEERGYDKNLATIEEILERGDVFQTDSSAYHALSNLFYMEIEEQLSNRVLMRCYEHFSLLKTRTKKMITRFLIKKNKEITLFNLLSYGLNLNWTIKKENGEENIVALEMLGSIPMIKMILSSGSFNICTTNKEGHNILHLLGTLPLMDNDVRRTLLNKIKNLDKQHQTYLFYQCDENQMTPLYKALYSGEEVLVDFLLELGANPETILHTLDETHQSALSFVTHLLKWESLMDKEQINPIWQKYYQEWTAKKLHHLLQHQLPSNTQPKRRLKI